MKWKVRLGLTDVFGGDGYTRPITVESKKLDRKKTRKLTAHNVGGLEVETSVGEEKMEQKEDVVHTFRELDGHRVLRLGGSHGKLWGALKDATEQLQTMGDEDFAVLSASRRLLGTVQIAPVWVPLEGDGVRTEQLPQKTNGMHAAMFFPYFDVLESAKCEVTVAFPDALAPKMKKLLGHLESMSVFNKRRTTVKVVSVEES
ncbi:MAG TPA: hypothetical protein VMG81_03435 [Thermoplasmata archaeon]|nr:hypothetical protein [Thermoplasmata archaeon]